MHSIHWGEFAIHHNGDFSGDVVVVNAATKQEMAVPAALLFHVAAAAVRSDKISTLEQMSDRAALGLPEVP